MPLLIQAHPRRSSKLQTDLDKAGSANGSMRLKVTEKYTSDPLPEQMQSLLTLAHNTRRWIQALGLFRLRRAERIYSCTRYTGEGEERAQAHFFVKMCGTDQSGRGLELRAREHNVIS